MSHLLIRFAYRFSSHGMRIPPGSEYDIRLGAWYFDGSLLARSSSFYLISKKCDVETGEDRKGA